MTPRSIPHFLPGGAKSNPSSLSISVGQEMRPDVKDDSLMTDGPSGCQAMGSLCMYETEFWRWRRVGCSVALISSSLFCCFLPWVAFLSPFHLFLPWFPSFAQSFGVRRVWKWGILLCSSCQQPLFQRPWNIKEKKKKNFAPDARCARGYLVKSPKHFVCPSCFWFQGDSCPL